jgi:serine protease DegQ
MKIGDVIIGVDGRPIQDSVAAMAAIAALKPGTSARFKVTRNQQDFDLGVTVAKRPAPPKARRAQ